MSINPEDINAFAGMLGKLDKIQEGKHSPKTAEEHQKAIASRLDAHNKHGWMLRSFTKVDRA